MRNTEVSLLEVLRFREKKDKIQRVIQSDDSDWIVVSLGMNIPGPVKTGASIYEAFLEGGEALEAIFQNRHGGLHFKAVLKETAGYAAVYQVEGIRAETMKACAVELEETHMLGRLFDIDVSDGNGTWIPRELVGGKTRKCLLCGADAKACGRNRTHTADALYEKVLEIMEDWKKSESYERKN